MQVHVLTNLSDPTLTLVSDPTEIVRERLPEGSAHYGERVLPFVWFYNGRIPTVENAIVIVPSLHPNDRNRSK